MSKRLTYLNKRRRYLFVLDDFAPVPARRELSFAEFRRIRKTTWGKALISRGSL